VAEAADADAAFAEAADADAAFAEAADAQEVESTDSAVVAKPVVAVEPTVTPPRPAVKAPRPVSPVAPRVIEDDPLAQALLVDTPPPAVATLGTTAPLGATAPLGLAASAQAAAPAPAPPQPSVEKTQVLAAAKAPAPDSQREATKRSEASTQPPAAAPRPANSKAPAKAANAAPAAVAAPPSEAAGWLRTGLFSLMAAGASYYAITLLFPAAPASQPAPTQEVATVPPVVPPVVPSAAVPAAAAAKQATLSEAPLPPGTDVPGGSGLLEVQVPEGTAIRVDGEYLGMGPGRRVPLTPGPHELTLGDGAPQSVSIKAGQRTLAVVASPAASPAGSP
jgi:hypothetical protein